MSHKRAKRERKEIRAWLGRTEEIRNEGQRVFVIVRGTKAPARKVRRVMARLANKEG